MAKYLVQKFECGQGNTIFYAQQDEHNHKKSNEFSKAAIDWLVKNAKWPKAEISAGKFMSNQNKPTTGGKELTWDDKGKKWVKA